MDRLQKVKLAWESSVKIPFEGYVEDAIPGDSEGSTVIINEGDLRLLFAEVERLREALKQIARSAPCVEGHESFNTPGQPCDQRIAEAALSPAKEKP